MTEPFHTHGLDTSVVLRLLVGDPADQAEAALRFVRDAVAAGNIPIISDLVVAEAYFALHKHYEVPKHDALKALLELLESGQVRPESGAASVLALKTTLVASKKIGFVDRLIHAHYAALFVSMVSFEKAAVRLPETRVLKA